MRKETKVLRSTLGPAIPGQPLHRGPVFAAPFHTPGDKAEAAYTYGGSGNPTWTALETALAQMESAPGIEASALVFASGMAAVAAVFGAVLRPGDVVVLPSNAFAGPRKLIEEIFVPMGITLRTAPTAHGAQAALLEGARLLWIETPSNPTLEIADVAALSEQAHRAGALVAVDNTMATAFGQQPLALGADISVASDAKALTGHSDLILGHVAVRDPALLHLLEGWRDRTGGSAGPMEAWLALRSIATLPLRLERSSANALRIAEFLATRPEVIEVFYHGLPTHAGYAVARAQMRLLGPALGFTLRDQAAAESFLAHADLVTVATSFGGVTTTAERRARWGSDDVPEGFIRLSAGCETIEDLLDDLAQALDRLPR